MKGAVAAGHKLTAETAAEILRSGGNAFDAVVAGFFVACVCESVLASLGGGGFLLAGNSDGQTRVFDFFTHTPRHKSDQPLDFYPVMVDFGSAQQEFHIGLGSCAAPGAVNGMFAIHRDLGSMPMAELMQPAIELARRGVMVEPFQAYLLRLVGPIYATPAALPLFCSPAAPERLMDAGDVFINAELGDVLETLAIEGQGLFYRGEIARELIRLCEDSGHLRYEDMTEYQTILREPLDIEHRGRRFYTNPPPSAGGILIAFGLNLLGQFDSDSAGAGSYSHIRTLVDILLTTSEVRGMHFGEGPHVGLLDRELLDLYQARVLHTTAAYRGTTHISVVDEQRNIAAMTVSNGEGCGELIPGTGVMMNNMLGEEDLNPAGLHGWTPNQRMSSMMAPSILLERDGCVTALGSGGSNRIRTAILQVVSNFADFGLDLETAVNHPRVHIETDVLNIEAGLPEATISPLTAEFANHRLFEGTNMFFGGVHVVRMDAAGGLSCMGDPRRSGVGIVV